MPPDVLLFFMPSSFSWLYVPGIPEHDLIENLLSNQNLSDG
jgi:hypothetical protein